MSWVNAPEHVDLEHDARRLTSPRARPGFRHVTCTDNGSNVAPTLISGIDQRGRNDCLDRPDDHQRSQTLSHVPRPTVTPTVASRPASRQRSMSTPSSRQSVSLTTATRAGGWTNHSAERHIHCRRWSERIKGIACSLDGNHQPLHRPQLQPSHDHRQRQTRPRLHRHVEHERRRREHLRRQHRHRTSRPRPSSSTAQRPSSAWLSGTPVVQVIGSEQGGILSGIAQITCSVNGGTPFQLPGDRCRQRLHELLRAATERRRRVSCTGTTVAGTTQTTPATDHRQRRQPELLAEPVDPDRQRQ